LRRIVPDAANPRYDEFDPVTQADLWVLPLEGERKPFPFLKTEFNEDWAALSPVPDSRGHLWMAYQSDETGRDQIYLRPFLPGSPDGSAGPKVLVSIGGGSQPQWRRDGRELCRRQQADGGRHKARRDARDRQSTDFV
jgi:Tol biopolymer transport system component